ncbi:16S rRNA (guanine(966)-N(2))-methyltransferase RsmD [Mycolicibacterium hodleri]|uniref:16S rRNA (Guanine(966)-N(2))-methyltransferase RsmD n=1 Tax=Mycolicibacterium hodleri TaxID=49897 RepID=A0A502EI53_9MYCO|nr:16S rRNA (guanine(966)-N(2))-methyltransferase RsmD [Mycolicibacterium hodleri]TPG37378.1 16S rRNA (guanine(966)-N(2))-methyltransferase RsmD [Mycolicibacterium hodleri]
MTRIVGGRFGGRRIAVPQGRSGRGTRPTTDRVRESLFNVLAARLDFDGVAVLDLYAGSGALGLEALSRGAASALFVEADRRAASVIEDNATALGATGAVVRCGSVTSVLASGIDHAVDVVFADPPYEVSSADVDAVLVVLVERGWLAPGAIAVVERPASSPVLTWPGWTAGRNRRYGDTRLEFGEIA